MKNRVTAITSPGPSLSPPLDWYYKRLGKKCVLPPYSNAVPPCTATTAPYSVVVFQIVEYHWIWLLL
eukprot:scaffold14888_cov67-Attheya_sp.AAC.1